MNKLIVVSTALISITLLSGCKSVVVHHGHSPAVVVDSRHYRERHDVHVIHHEPVVHHSYERVRDVTHRDRSHATAWRRPPVVVSKQPVRDGHFKNHVVQQSRPTPPPARNGEHQRQRESREQQRPSRQHPRPDSRKHNSREKQPNQGRSDNRRKDAPRGKGNNRGRTNTPSSSGDNGVGLKERVRNSRFRN